MLLKYPKIPFLLAIATATLLLYGCFLGPEREPCTGRLILENPISDTTVAVGDTLFIDLSNPPVFVSSEGRVSYDSQVLTGLSHVDLNFISNPNDDGYFSLFLIIGESVGKPTAELKAFSDCLENSTTFNITITEP